MMGYTANVSDNGIIRFSRRSGDEGRQQKTEAANSISNHETGEI